MSVKPKTESARLRRQYENLKSDEMRLQYKIKKVQRDYDQALHHERAEARAAKEAKK